MQAPGGCTRLNAIQLMAWEAGLKDWVWVFPGQGAHYVGMGRSLLMHSPAARDLFAEADALLGYSLSGLVQFGTMEHLSEIRFGQPAIFTVSVAMLAALEERFPGVQPLAVAGLSLGEYSALVAAQSISFREGLELVHERAEAMHEACQLSHGRMVAVLGMPTAEVARVIATLQRPDVVCANFNGPGQVVLSGSDEGIEAALEALRATGLRRTVALAVQGAFHSPYMAPAASRLARALSRVTFKPGRCPIALNVTGQILDPNPSWSHLLIQQMVAPVRWESCVHALTALKPQPQGFLEIGPGQTLSALIKRITHTGPVLSLDAYPVWEQAVDGGRAASPLLEKWASTSS
ncbi:MAG: ACP S-malonyltransferase [Chlamydiia bacterium]